MGKLIIVPQSVIREISAEAQLTFSFLFGLGPELMEYLYLY